MSRHIARTFVIVGALLLWWATIAVADPTIIEKRPAAGASDIQRTSLVEVMFSEDMDPRTVGDDTFVVTRAGRVVPGSVNYVPISRIAVFTPADILAIDGTYTATVTTGMRSSSGTPLQKKVTWTFSTTNGKVPLPSGMHIYFGDLHNHTGYSDGKGVPADVFATARARGCEFCAVTDHSNQLTAIEWEDMLEQANDSTIPGKFVGLRGFEFTHPAGHINVIDTETFVTEKTHGTLEKFFAWISHQRTAIGQFNHPYRAADKDFDDFKYDRAAGGKMYLREMSSYPENEYLLSLNSGWHLGAVANMDMHLSDWCRGARIGVVAPELSRDAILEALRMRRTFFVGVPRRFALVMQANGYWMGSVVPGAKTLDVTVYTYDPAKADGLLVLVVFDNGVPVKASTRLLSSPASDPYWHTWHFEVPGTPGHYYYAKAYLQGLDGFSRSSADGNSVAAYSSPVWMSD